jgi:hypothetical protein
VIAEGCVVSGRGIAAHHIGEAAEELKRLTGEHPYPGTLNVILDRPLYIDCRAAMPFGDRRFLWPARLNGESVVLYRWQSCPLHMAEFVASHRLRDALCLEDGSRVRAELGSDIIKPAPLLLWNLLWRWRERWAYAGKRYARFVSKVSGKTGLSVMPLSEILRRRKYIFRRIDLGPDRALRQAANLLNYTKTNDVSYSASGYPAGYHSLILGEHALAGQRDPVARIAKVPYDFTGKSVLDLGANQGGMLFALADKIRWGVGVDYDPRMVNAANRIARLKSADNLAFYIADLSRRHELEIVSDFMPEPQADICFLLSVCMWIRKWRDVIDFAAWASHDLLFESNGSDKQQAQQLDYLRRHYTNIQVLSETSDDDLGQKHRTMVLASNSPPRPVSDSPE